MTVSSANDGGSSTEVDIEPPPRRHEPAAIAVIIVCRNAIAALQRTVASVHALADPRIRLIIIDGASTDGTAEWLESVSPHLFRACSEPDRGIYEAMNKGWAAAPSDSLILYLGAGDLLYELPSDAQLRRPDGSIHPLVLGDTHVGAQPFRSRWHSEIRWRNTAHHQAMMLHKSVCPEPPFDESLRVYADWDFNLRLFRRGLPAHFVSSLRSYSQPGGASWSMDVAEIYRVSARHSGQLIGASAWALNTLSRWRRRRRDARAALEQKRSVEDSSQPNGL